MYLAPIAIRQMLDLRSWLGTSAPCYCCDTYQTCASHSMVGASGQRLMKIHELAFFAQRRSKGLHCTLVDLPSIVSGKEDA
jgi:hypothetical protein